MEVLRAPAPLQHRRFTPPDLTPARIGRGDQVEVRAGDGQFTGAPVAQHPAIVVLAAVPGTGRRVAPLDNAHTLDGGAQDHRPGVAVEVVAARRGQFICAVLSTQPPVMRLAGVALIDPAPTPDDDTHPLDGRADDEDVGRAPATALDLDGRRRRRRRWSRALDAG
ncbi:MAG: hypothetical protein EBT79_13305, partial [Actinobacteria bacterium]|nr:hypothetical protein [Actinomycetota bacterium]